MANLENPEKDLAGGFILGASDFVNWVKESFLSPLSDEKEIPQLRQLKPSIEKETIVEAVSKEFGCDCESILKKGSKKNTARDMAIYLARDLTGETCKKLGGYFDNISGSGVTLRYNHMVNELKGNRSLKACANKLRKQMVKGLKIQGNSRGNRVAS